MVIRLIQSLLPASRTKGQKKKRFYSNNESRDAFMVICKTEVEYKEHYDNKVTNESAVPPYISIIGSLQDPSAIMCDFENMNFKFFSLAKAIDICFKAYHLFNIVYPEACALMWQFLNRQFYELNDKEEKINPVTHMLLKDIKGNF